MAQNNKTVTGWVGWVGFASLLLLLAGFFHVIAGLAALFSSDVYLLGENNLWVLDYTQWGWLHILGGLLAIWAGNSLARGGAYGRIVAVWVALGSALANMVFIPVYPIWSLLIITIDIFIIYAVIVHAGELKD